jgi:hypothetical protein
MGALRFSPRITGEFIEKLRKLKIVFSKCTLGLRATLRHGLRHFEKTAISRNCHVLLPLILRIHALVTNQLRAKYMQKMHGYMRNWCAGSELSIWPSEIAGYKNSSKLPAFNKG